MTKSKTDPTDAESEAFLSLLAEQERVRSNRVPGVRTVLVMLSARGMVYDTEALRQKILLSYPDAAVFFRTTQAKPVGAAAPQQVDLLIDFTGPGQRQGLLYAKKLRRMARVTVGRNAGLFRKRIFDRVFDEKSPQTQLPDDLLERERLVQKQVLGLAGVALAQSGDTPPDRSQTIALELPSMTRI
jgi:hypothetical protein